MTQTTVVSAIVGAAVIGAAFLLNPSPDQHREQIKQAIAERSPVAGVLGLGALAAFTSTYHPLGGCPMGLATSDIGEVKGYPGMYVMDSSLFPDSLVANPALSTAAFAERNIERIIAQMA